MKKLFLVLFGIVLLAACTDETSQEVDETAQDYKKISQSIQATGKDDDGSPGDKTGE